MPASLWRCAMAAARWPIVEAFGARWEARWERWPFRPQRKAMVASISAAVRVLGGIALIGIRSCNRGRQKGKPLLGAYLPR